MKSATTSLHNYLASHPSIFMSETKEPTHFVDGEQLKRVSPGLYRRGYWRDRDRYLELFAAAGDAAVVGESSTCYAMLPQVGGVARRIAAFNPDARIVYIMRDPIERIISHYWHNAKWQDESRPIEKAVRDEPHYREWSHYARQLEPYLETFGRERVRVLTLEELQADPVVHMQDLYRWLGVDATVEQSQPERHNETGREISAATRLAFLRRLRNWRYWRAVSPMIPKPIRAMVNAMTKRKVDRRSIDTTRVVEYLRPLLLAETEQLTELLGREFPEWTTLYPRQSD